MPNRDGTGPRGYGPVLGWDKARFVTFFDIEFEKFGSPYLDGFFFPQYRNVGYGVQRGGVNI